MRTKRLRAETREKLRKEEDLKRTVIAPSFLPAKTKPLVIPEGPCPETSGPKMMAKALESSQKYKGQKVDGENKYTKKMRELIGMKL